jgi:hypothetical protein
VSTCCGKNGADRLARRRVATNAISVKRNETLIQSSAYSACVLLRTRLPVLSHSILTHGRNTFHGQMCHFLIMDKFAGTQQLFAGTHTGPYLPRNVHGCPCLISSRNVTFSTFKTYFVFGAPNF